MAVETADKLLLSTIEPLLLDAKAVAKLLACSPRHVAALHSRGRLPLPIRLSRCVRWDRRELERWIAAKCPCRDVWVQLQGAHR
jgi:predicted DNA-binding transcriptional regulator AlpA